MAVSPLVRSRRIDGPSYRLWVYVLSVITGIVSVLFFLERLSRGASTHTNVKLSRL